MDAESLVQAYLFLSTESEPGIPVNTSPNSAPFPPQGTPILDGVWSNSWSLDIPGPQFDAEVYSPGFRPSLHSTILASGPTAETFHPEALVAASDIRDEDLPVSNVTRPSETSFISSKSTLGVSEGSWPALANSNEDPRDNIIAEGNWHQDCLSMSAPLDDGRLYTGIHTSDPSALLSLPDDYRVITAVHHQEERASTGISQRSQNVGKCPSAVSSRSPLQPDEGREASPNQDRYWCSICGRDYSQKRGVIRHHRDVHEATSCPHCSDFEWHRRHELKEHLEEQHPDIHVSAALAEATRCRRTATIKKTRLRGQTGSPPAIEYKGSSWGESLPQSQTLPLPSVIEATLHLLYGFQLRSCHADLPSFRTKKTVTLSGVALPQTAR